MAKLNKKTYTKMMALLEKELETVCEILQLASETKGANFTNPLSGCLNPPCATLTPPSPISGYFAMTQDFQWVTSPAHLGYSLSCVQFSNTHYFLNKVKVI